MEYIEYSTEFNIVHIELLYILSYIKDYIMVKLTYITFYEDEERANVEDEMNIQCDEVVKYKIYIQHNVIKLVLCLSL